MIPIHQLLDRIRWDPEFAKGEFEIAYLDRVEHRLVRVSLRDAHAEPGDHFALQVKDADGYVHPVPLHRIREVCRDGILIWKRPD